MSGNEGGETTFSTYDLQKGIVSIHKAHKIPDGFIIFRFILDFLGGLTAVGLSFGQPKATYRALILCYMIWSIINLSMAFWLEHLSETKRPQLQHLYYIKNASRGLMYSYGLNCIFVIILGIVILKDPDIRLDGNDSEKCLYGLGIVCIILGTPLLFWIVNFMYYPPYISNAKVLEEFLRGISKGPI